KGGVGKTATAQNLGASLANMGFKILLIDLDAQANLSISFGIDSPEKTIYEALKGEIKLPIYNVKTNLDVVPSNLNLSAIEIEMLSQAGRDFFLKNLIEDMDFNYDYIIIDCPPSIGVLTVNALTASNGVIIPMEAHFLAVQGISKLYEIINIVKKWLNFKLEVLGVLITKFDKRTTLQNDIKKAIYEDGNNHVFNTYIRINTSIAEATYKGQDIFEYAPSSNGARDYNELGKELIELLNK
ncbi:MAG: ParA family protein, partial [Tissierellia bacterium]|nr:ParA family protein [Tissierellia bacterium]